MPLITIELMAGTTVEHRKAISDGIHEAMKEVLGIPDDYYGEVVGAAVRPAGAAVPDLAADLEEYCRTRLADEKVPARWLVTGAFPMTASGKIRKDALRELLTREQASEHPEPPLIGRP